MMIPTRPSRHDHRPWSPGGRAVLAGRLALLAAIALAVVTASFTIAGFGPTIASAVSPGQAGQAHSDTSGVAGSTAVATARIVIDGYQFAPATLTVSPGTRISVRNTETATLDVTADDGSFSTGAILPGDEATITAPSTPGSYPYRCTALPLLSGTLVVR